MAELITLKKRRSYIKGSMTKLLKYIHGVDSDTKVEDIKVRLSNVERYRNEFIDIENKIVTLDNSEELDVDFEDNYYNLVAGLNLALRSKMEPACMLNETTADTSLTGGPMDVKLPKISIPFFTGDYTEWQSYHDLFCSTIHDNPRLRPSQKLQYLKSTLKGEAAGLLKHISITDANYIEAFKKLRDRYDRKKHTIYAFIKNFMYQPAVTIPNSANVRRLLDTSDEIVRGLKALGEDAELRDNWLIHILVTKLDEDTNSAWAQISAEYDLPTLKQFFDFLSKRIDALESLKGANRRTHIQANNPKVAVRSHAISNQAEACKLCPEEQHKLFECVKFNGMSIDERRALLKQERRCFNCLNNNHSVYLCKSKFRCKQCNKKHHSLLHENVPNSESTSVVLPTIKSNEAESSSYNTSAQEQNAILPTALVYVADGIQGKQLCRVLLDSGSQGSFITENCVKRLQLKRTSAKRAISGIGASINGYTKGVVSLTITPWNKAQPCFQTDAYIFPKLTAKQAPVTELIDLVYFKAFDLADPYFYKNAEIDIIIGADLFFELLSEGKIATNDKLIMQKTLLGWVVAGKSEASKPKQSFTVNITSPADELETVLKKFWEIEAIQINHSDQTKEEELCEKYFNQTTTTDSDGRFQVNLPFKHSPSILGESFGIAVSRMHAVEKRFLRDQEFASEYKQFMSEYIKLGHMKEIDKINDKFTGYYLPHHGVVKKSSTTTKLRVVFDGSAKTTSGKSLNDCLAVGPIIQSSLYEILSRFRLHKFAFTADIEKMYRQVRVANDDTKYQRIIWRDSTNHPFTTYELQTVTYGTASATYLATRALNEAADKFKDEYAAAVNHIKTSMYVDDLMTGAESVEDAIILKDQINSILLSSGFPLRKWLSNCQSLLTNSIQPIDQNKVFQIEEGNFTKVLGLHWNPKTDYFQFKVQLNEKPSITKRGILSEASRLFDPLGWLAPITIGIKIFFQSLWTANISWDEPLPVNLATGWLKIREKLPLVENIKIDRYINTTKTSKITLHGFCDASKYAYSAVVYGHVTTSNERSTVKLISAKTKVAPVKQISIPRLELCGALLLSRLLLIVKKALNIEIVEIIAWTDSTIVLDWLSAHPTKWTTFVGNRTGEILTNMSRSQWRHVISSDNPADCASRGIEPEKLQNFDLWWNGPRWLLNLEKWPKNVRTQLNTSEEIRTLSFHTQTSQPNVLEKLIENLSSFGKLSRVLAYVYRFINIKLKRITRESMTPYLIYSELQKSRCILYIHTQRKHFQQEMNLITLKKMLPQSSRLKLLKPFIDDSGVLRVGGRISNPCITYDVKHPVILPANDELTKMIVREHHIRYLHAGQTLMMATLRQRYWILGGRNLIRKTVHNCVKCTRYNPRELNQVMGNLPKARVELVRPFFKVGVDYAGPVQTHLIRGRGQKTYKSYICIFVCLATKAVHIELVSDLTTEAYIAALRRFVARRGICNEIHSDNGTNFIGARNHLNELYTFLRKNSNAISNFLLTEHIIFKFIPPSTPHFGGIWEAAVKSMKYHLRRVTNGHILTMEEMSTLLVEIESMLNSRPICVLSNDDTNYLTPGHFLIGRPTTQIPAEDLTEIKLSKLSRWEMLQQINQHIWRRWHLEYLTNLQQRTKWHETKNNVKIGDIVLIKENNLPPTKWLMGRIVELYPGSDNNIRVVDVKTATGIIKRPIHKLCLLPIS